MARMFDGWTHDDRTNQMLEGAGIGAAIGAVIGLVAGLILDEGVLAFTLAGAVIGAAIGALIRYLRSEDFSRHHEGVRTAPVANDGAARMHEERVLPVVEEELAIGKREVTKGGVRVHTRVTSLPAEQSVQLREEHATIERIPVDRPAAAGDDLFKERTFEILEMAEEAVVQKRSRVKEEVRIGKRIEKRMETVRETVRKTDIEVERAEVRPDRRLNKGPYAGQERRLAAVR